MDTLTPFMLEAKREYLSRLANEITPFIIRDMQRMSETTEAAAETSRDDTTPTMAFQMALRDIPKWNAAIVAEKTAAIEAKCPCLAKLIAAVFVSYIKVMSSVRVSGEERPNLRLKLPVNDAFIHRVYIESARTYYEDPTLVHRGSAAKKEAIFAAIETTVRDLLPIQDILAAYLGDTVKDGSMPTVLSPVHSDGEDSDIEVVGDDDDANVDNDDDDDDDDDACIDIPGQHDTTAMPEAEGDDNAPAPPAGPFPQAPPPPMFKPAGPAPMLSGMPPIPPLPPAAHAAHAAHAAQSQPRQPLFDDAMPDHNFR